MTGLPGAHVALFSDSPYGAVEGRLRGLELRDTILVLRPGPRSGFVFLFRHPLEESTVAGQVLATGTGAIHVDATRVGSGRWPPNVVLVHAPGCRQEGSRRIPTGVAVRHNLGKTGGHYGFGRANPELRQDIGYADEHGLETVAAWSCTPGCPVPVLDALSEEMGIHGAGGAIAGRPAGLGYDATSYHLGRERTFHRFGDAGGATRFYPQFASESELVAWVERLITVLGKLLKVGY